MFEIALNVFLLVMGILMLSYGADRLVLGASSIARTYRVSITVIGLTVVAIGTSAPELAAGIAAAYVGNGEIILGNVIGSNIANIGMVIGVAMMLGVSLMSKRKTDIYIMLAFSALCILISVDGEISYMDGGLLLACLVGFMIYTLRDVIKKKHAITAREEKPSPRRFVLRDVLCLVFGLLLLYLGSILTIDNAILLAEYLGLSSHVIGISVIAVGTSLPELITTIVSIRRGQIKLGLANIVGSNIMNILLILGVTSLINEIVVKPVIFTDYFVMVLFSLALLVPLFKNYARMGKIYGSFLIGAYGLYMVMLLLVL